MQKIDHLIDGKAVPGTDYFETVNPATQGVLAEVAAGGAAEVNAAVAAAKAAVTTARINLGYATVTAHEQSNRPELDRNALVPIARKHRPLAEALNQLYEERVLLSALARSRVFGVLSEPELRQLTRKLETVAVPAGTLVVPEGLPAKGAWVVKRGAFRVTFRADGREVAVALLRPHEVFGDLAEGRDLPQAESVTAVSEAELLFLAAEELAGFRARSSRLAEALDALRLERAKMCVAALRAGRR